MRRLGRWTRNALLLLSLLVCLATVKLWLYSYGASGGMYCQHVSHGTAGQYDQSVGVGYDRGGAYLDFNGIGTPPQGLQIHPEYSEADGWSWHLWSAPWGSSGRYPYVIPDRGRPELFRFAGFQVMTGFRPEAKDPYRRHTAALVFPLWAVVLLMALAPLRFLWHRRRGRRRTPSDARRCPACGYDLRATPARCRECGAVPATPPTT